MTHIRTSTIVGLAVLLGLALSVCLAKEQAASSSLASKLIPSSTRSRTARSLSDMFEKVKSKIFGGRKQQQAAAPSNQVAQQIQPVSSISSIQRQPWASDLNSFNQQYGPYSSLSSSNYQWPSGVSGQSFAPQQYNGPLNSASFSQAGSSIYPSQSGLMADASQPQASVSQVGSSPGSSSSSAQSASSQPASSGLLSSASHLIAQYLSPGSSSASSSSSAAAGSAGSAASPSSSQQSQPQFQSGQSLLSPQQQSQYNEFASIIDSMVAQTGVTSQRQPSLNQYLSSGVSGQQQPSQGQQAYQPSMAGVSDIEMSGSSNIQSYMPTIGQQGQQAQQQATPQQASQKSSMVSLAEQLAPGAQFNKLVSFPFSLSNNDDPSKEGRYKLHIPFLNSHVKRSDSQQIAQQQQQQRQQYLNSYYQQQQYAAALAASQQQQQQPSQMVAQASQVVPTIVSPQQPSSGVSSVSAAQPAPQTSASASVAAGPIVSVSQSSAASGQQQPASSASLSASGQSSAVASSGSNSRPAWSVADMQSSASKLIPIQSSVSSSVETNQSS